jgi:hypothetical protein
MSRTTTAPNVRIGKNTSKTNSSKLARPLRNALQHPDPGVNYWSAKMKSFLRFLLFGGTALVSLSIADFAAAQSMPPPQPPAGPVAAPPPPPAGGFAYDLQQLPETRGTVQRFTLTPRGDLDGFLLADGTDVHLPPHLSVQLAAAVRPGDPVSVRGYRSAAVPLIVAAAVIDSTANQMVVDRGPPPPGFGPAPPLPPGVPAPGSQQASLTGKVQTPLYGPAGDLNGAALEDGTIVRLPPPAAYQFASLLSAGQTVTIQGWALGTPYGRVIEAQAITPASAQMMTGTPLQPPVPATATAPPSQPPGRP